MTHGKYGIMKKRKIVWDDYKRDNPIAEEKGESFVKKGKEQRAGQAEMKKMHGGWGGGESFLLSVSLCISPTQQSGSASPSSLSYKRAVTHSSALHSLATEGR